MMSVRNAAAALAGIVLLTAAAVAAQAGDYRAGDVTVAKPWARATASTAKNGAAYVHLSNRGDEADRLVAVSSAVARKVHLHTNINDNGIMRMRPLDGVDVPPGGAAAMKPGGHHIMLMGLQHPLVEGEHFPMTLTFEKAGKVTVEVMVMSAGHGGGMKHGGHGSMKKK